VDIIAHFLYGHTYQRKKKRGSKPMTEPYMWKPIQQMIDEGVIPDINGVPAWAVVEYAENAGATQFDNILELGSAVEDAFYGIYESEKAFGEGFADEIAIGGSANSHNDPLAIYFDYEMFTRDLFMGDFYSLEDPSRNDPDFTKRNYDIAVFRNM
jgi:antirestriction protein